MENHEERARHSSESEEPLGKVGDPLFNDVVDFCSDVSLPGPVFVGVCDDFGDTQGFGVEGCLGNEAVWEWNTQKACDSGSES